MGDFTDLNEAGLLAIGLNPEWVDLALADWSVPPALASSGVYLQGSPVAVGYVAARESVHRREARITIDTFDLTVTVYTTVIDGNTVAYDAAVETPASNAALVAGIAAKIDGDVAAGLVVDAITDPDDATAILITGKAAPDFSFDATVAGGTGAITATAAATGFDVQLYTTPAGTVKSGSVGNADRWVGPVDGLWAANSYGGWAERLAVAGLDRGHLHVFNLTRHAADGGGVTATIAGVMIGPTT